MSGVLAYSSELPVAAKEVSGDLTLEHIVHGGDVLVHGNVCDCVTIESGGAVRIGGISTAQRVLARGGITVLGGIKGANKAQYVTGGSLRTHYLDNAAVEAAADVLIDSEAVNSHIICGGRLIVRRGTLVAGRACARGGIHCRQLGSLGGRVRTIVEIGIDAELEGIAVDAVRQVETSLSQARKSREASDRLVRHQRHLTAQQKELATELIFDASDMEAFAASILNQFRQRIQESDQQVRQRLRVMQVVHPPVTIRFLDVEADIEQPAQGPVSVARLGGVGKGVVAVLRNGRVIAELNARNLPESPVAALRRLIRQQFAAAAPAEREPV